MIDDSAWVWKMSGLTRDGTAEPVLRDQILRREQEQTISLFSCPRAGLATIYPVDALSAKCDDHVYIITYINAYVST